MLRLIILTIQGINFQFLTLINNATILYARDRMNKLHWKNIATTSININKLRISSSIKLSEINFACVSHFPPKSCTSRHTFCENEVRRSHFHRHKSLKLLYKNTPPFQGTGGCQGRKILIVFVTWSLQKGHLETAEEHLRQSTWPQGTIVIFTSALRQTRQIHAAFAESASFAATSTFSCIVVPKNDKYLVELSNQKIWQSIVSVFNNLIDMQPKNLIFQMILLTSCIEMLCFIPYDSKHSD